jgi:hypothetical protein
MLVPQLAGHPGAVVGHRGRHPYVDHDRVGRGARDRVDERVGVGDRGDDLVPGLGEQADQPLPATARSTW